MAQTTFPTACIWNGTTGTGARIRTPPGIVTLCSAFCTFLFTRPLGGGGELGSSGPIRLCLDIRR